MATAPETDTATSPDERAKPPFLRRVRIRGYKSIAFCDVTLEPLTILVGRNASGKSNFVDAIAFLRDMTSTNLVEAIKRHGGIKSITFRGPERTVQPQEIGFAIECDLPVPTKRGSRAVCYSVSISVSDPDGARITSEEIIPLDERLPRHIAPSRADLLRVAEQAFPTDQIRDYLERMYPSSKPLAGMNRTGWSEIGLGGALGNIGVYSFTPDLIREIQKSNPGGLLERSGRNLPDVIRHLQIHAPRVADRIAAYLAAITDGIEGFDAVQYGEFETIRFKVRTAPGHPNAEFDAASMSDGTLRALAALVAVFQSVPPNGSPSLVAIEEPETSLHPAAMRALVDALDEATLRTQILLTTHSAELLDNPTIRPENVRVVEMVNGATAITPVDDATVSIVRDRLSTLGGLERDRQLQLNLDDVDRQAALATNGQSAP